MSNPQFYEPSEAIPFTPVTHSEIDSLHVSTEPRSLSDRFRRVCIGAFLVADTAVDELNSGMASQNLRGKVSLATTSAGAVGGQLYERFRLPEVIGVSATSTLYRESLEHGWNSAVATTAASVGLGALVYVQQKAIGKNWVKTAEHFPETYNTVNAMWPKTMGAIQDALPTEKNRIGEGYTMFGLGTTPFIASAKAANPEITQTELAAIERRVTRRGSVFAAGVGATVLGIKSGAVHLPARAGEEATKWGDRLIDVASSPYIVAGTLTAASVAKAVIGYFRKPKTA